MDHDAFLELVEKVMTKDDFKNALNEVQKEFALRNIYYIKTVPPIVLFGARAENPDSKKWEDVEKKIKNQLIGFLNIDAVNEKPVQVKVVATPEDEVSLLLVDVLPYLHQDGGSVQITSIDEEKGEVVLNMMGSCSGCPSSISTLAHGIKTHLQKFLHWVKGVKSDQPPITPNFGFKLEDPPPQDVGGES